MKKQLISVVVIVWLVMPFFAVSAFAEGKTYKATLAHLDLTAKNKDEGILVELVKMWAKATGNTIEIGVYPFKRSLENAISGEADFHLPMIKNPYKTADELGFKFSTTPIFNVNFVLYTNKDKPIDKNNLSQYKITTDAAHVDFFDFKISADFNIESALKKLSLGRIDGFIFADSETDLTLKKLGLKNIKRELYKVYDVHAVLPLGDKGKDADQMITEAMQKVSTTSEFKKLMTPLTVQYSDWQP
jgi:polar amino acid transport system substrate-binding protein